MKNIYFKAALILLITALLTVSCTEDFLDQTPTSTLTEITYFKNVAELETGLVACYGALGSFSGFELDQWVNGDIGSDDAEKGSLDSDQAPILEICFSRQVATNGWILGLWADCYAVIARCNEVIDKSAGTQGVAADIEKIVDQAKFLRALCFYQLVIAFGDVPLVNKFLSPSELTLTRAPAADIWKQIESDLIDASNLPKAKEWNQSGRISSGTVYTLLGKVYLTQKKYALANSAFYKVVSSNEYRLVNDFGFIFRHDGENCAESIFEIQHKSSVSGGTLGTYSGPLRLPRDFTNGYGFDCPTGDLLNEFEPGDPRAIYTFLFKGDVFPIDGVKTYTVENRYSPTGYNSRKAWIPFSERTGLSWQQFDINYRLMRYAEVLLLYAESLNEVNKQDSARMLVNKVRERARKTPATDPQRISCSYNLSHPADLLPDVTTSNQAELRQAIWHEQRVELATEGHRRWTLLRTDRFKTRMEAAKGSKGCTVEPHELLYPIPQSEIDVSVNMLTQNPGY
jgi:starch-binding outer membrane protein, SusD/RagB family